MKKKNGATLKDIARRANVTVTAVSLALQKKDTTRVGKKTREKILKIAKELNYRPNYIAKTLVTKKSHAIGLIITTLHNPFYAELAQYIIEKAAEAGYSVLIESLRGEKGDEQKAIDELLMRGVDGLIICAATRQSEAVYELARQGVPFVLAMRSVIDEPDLPKLDTISMDNERGAYLATQHLILLGHRRIGFIGGPDNVSTGYDRKSGFLAALRVHKIKADKNLMLSGNYLMESGYEEGNKMLKLPKPPSAVFAANDHMAVGFMTSAYEKGLSVPDDIAVVGFDDIDIAALPSIDLTTISQKKKEMGPLAVKRLIEKIEGKNDEIAMRVMLEPRLIVRKSCGMNLFKKNQQIN